MATCEVCGNEYDESFEIVAAGARTSSTVVRSRRWLRSASIANAGSLATASKWTVTSSAVPIARGPRPQPMCGIVLPKGETTWGGA
jgi:hypothetical protein